MSRGYCWVSGGVCEFMQLNPGPASLLTGYLTFVFQYLIRLPGDSDLGATNTEIQ